MAHVLVPHTDTTTSSAAGDTGTRGHASEGTGTARRANLGRSLYDLTAADGPLPRRRVARIAAAAAEELGRLHREGLVHGDIRPETLVVCDDDRVWLIDPGTASRIPPMAPPTERRAPELARASASSATDVYDLGVVLVGALGGSSRTSDHRRSQLRAPTAPESLPARWRQLLMAMVADTPTARIGAASAAHRWWEVAAECDHETEGAEDRTVVSLFPAGGTEPNTDGPDVAAASPLPNGPTPRQLGAAVAMTVTVLFGLLFSFGSADKGSTTATADGTSAVSSEDAGIPQLDP